MRYQTLRNSENLDENTICMLARTAASPEAPLFGGIGHHASYAQAKPGSTLHLDHDLYSSLDPLLLLLTTHL